MAAREPFAHRSVDTTESTTSSLIGQLRAESPAAWARFVSIYTPLVYRWTRRAGIPANDAPDLVQEVFQGVSTQIRQFRRLEAANTFRGWLYTITRNKACDYFRRRHGQTEAVGGSEAQQRLATIAAEYSESSGGSQETDDRTLVLRHAVEQLRGEFTDNTWTAFWRLAVDGHRASDIGRDLGLTAKAVRQAKYRVLTRLREELSELE